MSLCEDIDNHRRGLVKGLLDISFRIDHWTYLSDHHGPIREGKIDNKDIGRCSERLDLEENVDHTPVAKEADDEQEEVRNAYEMIGQRVLGGELGPVLVHNLQSSPVKTIQLTGALVWRKKTSFIFLLFV